MTDERAIQPAPPAAEPAIQPAEAPAAEPEESIRATLAAIARRLPAYAQLAARLAADTRLASSQRTSLAGLAGRGAPLGLLPGIGPLLVQADRLLRGVQAIHVVLQQVQPEVADEHLHAVGLSRAQVEADLRDITRITRHLGQVGADRLDELSVQGARAAARLVGKGLRAWRSYQARTGNRDGR
ncbi:MAG: hypothetical protein QJR03_14625 [Sphaerobacter sp.]|nr:hypothetical protein [Sphaerobacter sp.]